MPFGLCNAPATFQWLMQNCMGELNLIYCLIYLDNLIVFSWMAEEYLHWLQIVFDWLREYNLKLKLSKCSLFKEKINYLAHQVSKQGIQPSDTNLNAIAECALLQTYTRLEPSLALLAMTGSSLRVLWGLPNHWMSTWQGRGPAESQGEYLCLKRL